MNFFFIKTKSSASYKQIFTQTMTLSMASVFIITLFHNIFTNFRALPSMLFNLSLIHILIEKETITGKEFMEIFHKVRDEANEYHQEELIFAE